MSGHAATREASFEGSSAWSITAMVPPASPALTLPVALFESLSVANADEPLFDDHHPDNPSFMVNSYYNHITQAFHCPHGKEKSCKKPLKTATALIAHLRSPIHRNLESQTCQFCHRPFPNATAYTQHVESQAIRCSARKTGNISTWVEDHTQFATIDGRHDDDTNKYVNRSDRIVNPGETVANVFESRSRAAEARANFQEAYWTTRKLKEETW
ncbi:hypothetical protein D0Z07_5068 [Hyphodiscus hymeniophilus]|uniref:C2H2-type domain-containing protein n=1 Tax=Hyphodiscus hymeniophilus TaxID=353542 RepID=A0A9P6VJ37_9HELO|nr:hypothetical protein D0Z07_5068 [Hyphodiscus hymeniophilus]